VRGLGVARLPDRLAADALEAGALTRLFPRMTVPTGAVHAVMPAGRYQPAKVRVFVDEVQRAMRE
jgi:DNA-binding transcriptional LysR family regulator